MKKLLEALEKKGAIKNLQKTANIVPMPKDMTEDEQKELLDEAISECLDITFKKYKDLCDLFAEFCYKVGMKELVKALDIKPDPNYVRKQKDLFDLLLSHIVGDIREALSENDE